MKSEITNEMYLLAKKIVEQYENKKYYLSHRLIDLDRIEMRRDNKNEVKYDWNSREPSFVDYNTIRLEMYKAESNGQRQIERPISVATTRELELDGYTITGRTIKW